MNKHLAPSAAYLFLARWRSDLDLILHLLRIGECDQLKGLPALDAHHVARDLREIADQIESKAKDYRSAA